MDDDLLGGLDGAGALRSGGVLARQCGARAPELWLSCGAQDDLLEENIALVDGLRQAGIPAHFDQPPGAHNWDFWDREIQRVIDWLMP